MAYDPNAQNVQVRVDAYDASAPQYPSAASLTPAIFDPSSITAGPFLGSLLSASQIQSSDDGGNWHTLTADLSPYVGKDVYFTFRSVGDDPMDDFKGLDNFNVFS